ncbi:hypothetical protein B5E80_08245 [Flavonifractor sp. An135]|nr:hypothetical protein B5E80_08245 [Flavonifractor sp. An135]
MDFPSPDDCGAAVGPGAGDRGGGGTASLDRDGGGPGGTASLDRDGGGPGGPAPRGGAGRRGGGGAAGGAAGGAGPSGREASSVPDGGGAHPHRALPHPAGRQKRAGVCLCPRRLAADPPAGTGGETSFEKKLSHP